jgi:hypothetical protein
VKIDGKNYSWTQPICETCFAGLFPKVENPHRIKDEFREDEHCCVCNLGIRNGLYVRLNPTTVPHPTPDKEEQ